MTGTIQMQMDQRIQDGCHMAEAWYYFDDWGDMYGDQWVDHKYYIGCDGRMVSGWYDCSQNQQIIQSTSWMYFNA